MRFGEILLLAGVLLAPPPVAAADDPMLPDYVCSGEAQSERGESFSVSLFVDKSGKPIHTVAVWFPPTEGDLGHGDLTRPDVTFSIAYQGTATRLIGLPFQTDLSVSLFSPLRSQMSPNKLAARLGTYSGQFRFGDDAFVPMEKLTQRSDMELPGSVQSSQKIALPDPLPAWLDVQVFDSKHKLATSVRFDLRATNRDALLGKAMSQVESAQTDFKSCPAG